MKTLTRNGRILFLAIGIAFAGAFSFVASARLPSAHAAELPPPSRVAAADLVKLDRALSHINLINAAAQQQAAPYAKEIGEVCALYKVDPAQLGKTVGIDLATGEIQRAPVKTAQAPAGIAK